jgi:hypothetical protein
MIRRLENKRLTISINTEKKLSLLKILLASLFIELSFQRAIFHHYSLVHMHSSQVPRKLTRFHSTSACVRRLKDRVCRFTRNPWVKRFTISLAFLFILSILYCFYYFFGSSRSRVIFHILQVIVSKHVYVYMRFSL